MKKFFLLLVCLLICELGSPPSFADVIDANSSPAPADNNVIQSLTQLPLDLTPPDLPAQAPPRPGSGSGTVTLLPNLGEPAQPDASVLPTPNGTLQFKGSLDGDRFLVKQDFNNAKGAPVDVDLATQKIPDTTVGWLVSAKPNQTEAVMNMGWRLGENQQLLFSTAQMRGLVDADVDGKSNPNLSQHGGGLDYRFFVDQKWLTGIELSGYSSGSQSQFLPATMTDDNQQHIAGGNLVGVKLGLESAPLHDSKLKIGVGSERLSYDSLSGVTPIQNLNTSIKWSQIIMPTVRYNASIEDNGVLRSLSTGLDVNLQNGQQLGFKLAHTQSSDGLTTDSAVQLSYTLQFGNKFAPFQAKDSTTPWNSSLMPEVLQRPSYLPKSLLSKPDSSLN